MQHSVSQPECAEIAAAELAAVACDAPLATVIVLHGTDARIDSTHGSLDVELARARAFATEVLARSEPLVVDDVRAGLVLLDLNMPGMDGRMALAAIRATPELRQLPVVVLTTSKLDEDVVGSYEAGVNSVIRKPVRFEGLVDAFRVLSRYWFQIVELPGPRD